MTLTKPLLTELVRIIAGVFGCLLLAGISGSFWLWFTLALIVYLAWNMLNLNKLVHWLADPKQVLPQSKGLWATIFDQFYYYQKSNQLKIKKLERGLELFEDTATALPDATIMLGTHNVIKWCNESAERLLGLNKSRDYGQRIDNLIRNPAFINYINLNEHKEIIEMPSPIEESIILRIRVVTYGRKRRLLLARNISRLHHLDQMKSDFIANVSHELRTPLTVISGYIETLYEKSKGTNDNQTQSLAHIKNQSERMLHIIDDLLFLSKLETSTTSGRKEIVNIPALLTSLEDNVRPLSEKRQQSIAFDIDRLVSIRGSRSELNSAFSNLIYNAIKYTPDKGHVWISWKKTDQGAELEVRDSGYGIPTQQIPRLTERFYRVDVGRSREQGGTGLGLAIVKHIMVRHNAQLKISSQLGSGSIFKCVFPLSLISLTP